MRSLLSRMNAIDRASAAETLIYSETDHFVWKELFRRQSEFVQRHACDEYLAGFMKLKLPVDRVCSVEALNDRMRTISRWRFLPSNGLADSRVFFQLLSQFKFPVATSMRRPEEIEFSELPD